jgi:hypothetical protein
MLGLPVRRGIKVFRVPLEQPGRRDHPVLREHRDTKDFQAFKGRRVFKVQMGRKDRMVRRVRKEIWDFRETKGRRVPKVIQVRREMKATRAIMVRPVIREIRVRILIQLDLDRQKNKGQNAPCLKSV